MMVFGILITTQLRVQQQLFTDPGKLRANELAIELKATEEKLRASEAQRTRLEAEIQRLQQGPATAAPQRDTTQIEMLAGTLGIEGPGLIVTLSEMNEKSPLSDEDVWRVVNELLVAGAEGLTVGGERFTSVTGVREVGLRIMVHQKMISPPVVIEAIGDPVVMETALRMRGGVVETLGRWGVKATIQRSESLRLPPAGPPPAFRFAKPAGQ